MTHLWVKVDDNLLASIPTADKEVVAVRISGTRVDVEYAGLNAHAGVYTDDCAANHRIWIDEMPLTPGQWVEVGLSAGGSSVGNPKTIDELFADAPISEDSAPLSRADLFADIRKLQAVRDGFKLHFTTSSGCKRSFVTLPDEHGFGFSVLWNNLRPERASASLHGYTIESVEQGTPTPNQIRELILVGESVRLDLQA